MEESKMTDSKKIVMEQLKKVAGGVCGYIPRRVNIEQAAMSNQQKRIPWRANKGQ